MTDRHKDLHNKGVHARFWVTSETYHDPKRPPGSWSQLLCSVYTRDEAGNPLLLGTYKRRFSNMYSTFEPFEQNGRFYALVSPNYTRTAVIRLKPGIELIAEEQGEYNDHFCPVEFFVPEYEYPSNGFDDTDDLKEFCVEPAGMFGFVSGCAWGDDWSWKLQMLDLSRIEEGIITRSQPFGYCPLPPHLSLKEAVYVETDLGMLEVHACKYEYKALPWPPKADE